MVVQYNFYNYVLFVYRLNIVILFFQGDDISGYEDSIAMHITRMLASNQYEIVIQSAR